MTPKTKHESASPYLGAYLVLLLLLGLSIISAYLPIGVWKPAIEYAIAATQTALLFVMFMRLRGPPSLKWVFAGAGFFWLIFLFGLATTDYATRTGLPEGAPEGHHTASASIDSSPSRRPSGKDLWVGRAVSSNVTRPRSRPSA